MLNSSEPILNLLVATSLLLSVFAHADTADDVQHWYETEYAPLWFSATSADPASVSEFFTTPYRRHPMDRDSFLSDNSAGDWQQRIESIIADGWVGGDLIRVDVTALSDQAAYVFAQWRDKGGNEAQPVACDSYVVTRRDDHWKISNYIPTTCE